MVSRLPSLFVIVISLSSLYISFLLPSPFRTRISKKGYVEERKQRKQEEENEALLEASDPERNSKEKRVAAEKKRVADGEKSLEELKMWCVEITSPISRIRKPNWRTK